MTANKPECRDERDCLHPPASILSQLEQKWAQQGMPLDILTGICNPQVTVPWREE